MAATMKPRDDYWSAIISFVGVFVVCMVFFLLLSAAYHLGQERCKQQRAEHPSTTHVNGGC